MARNPQAGAVSQRIQSYQIVSRQTFWVCHSSGGKLKSTIFIDYCHGLPQFVHTRLMIRAATNLSAGIGGLTID
jgi:hypothetical protein